MPNDAPDVLLVTDNRLESRAVLGVFEEAAKAKARPVEIGRRTYFDLGAHNGRRVFLTQSEIDSATNETVRKAIETLQPGTVIQVASASARKTPQAPEEAFASQPFFSALKNAEGQWSGRSVRVQGVNSDASWILVEGAGDASNAASFILGTIQAASPEIPSSLPRQPFFVGREKELAVIAEALSPELRTWGVLIDGPGGIGKTALAIRAGHVARQFAHKIFLSAKIRELTPLGERPREDFIPPNYLDLLSEIARGLGDKDLAKLPESDRAASLRRTLTGKRALIVIDNLETFPDAERSRVYEFLSRIPEGCKAIVTSRRRSDLDARVIRLDRLDLENALLLMDELAKTNRPLSAATLQERQLLYEFTGGNPLLLSWTAGQLGRPESRCTTVAEACEFLKNAPADNDPLEYIFGDLLDTFTPSETAVLAALTHFNLPVAVKWTAEFSGLALPQAQLALEDLADRALIVADPSAQTFYLPPLAAKFLAGKRPEVVAQTGERLAERAYQLAIENGGKQFERFPVLEAEWAVISAAIPLLVKGENDRLQRSCQSLRTFLDFSGRWDDWHQLERQAETVAVAANDFLSAGRRAYYCGCVSYLRGQASEVLAAADRAETQWRKARTGPQELGTATRLRGLGRELEGNSEEATKAYREALRCYRLEGAESIDVASVLNDLASVEHHSGRYDDAEANYREALRIAAKIGDRHTVAIFTGNLASLALDREDWPLAEKTAREALDLSELVGRQELIGTNYSRLAEALARQGRAVEGLPYARRAVDIFTRLGQASNLAFAEAVLKECQS